MYINSQGSSVYSSASPEDIEASHTAQVFHRADRQGEHRYFEYPGENFDDQMWTADHTAGSIFTQTNVLDLDQDYQATVTATVWATHTPYEMVDPEIGSAAVGCFGDWATWSASPKGWEDWERGGVYTEPEIEPTLE